MSIRMALRSDYFIIKRSKVKMKNYVNDIKEMRSYLLLWFTQLISGLGSAMTAYALVIWS